MQRGTALRAPTGWYGLDPDLTYHFLSSNRTTGKAQIVLFYKEKVWNAMLIQMDRDQFECGLVSKAIQPVPDLSGPPHLHPVKGKDLTHADMPRTDAKAKHADRVDYRLLKIQPLLAREYEILCAERPEREINRYATENGLNTQRTRFWFFAYVTFRGHNCVLYPQFFNCGGWDRMARDPKGRKYGRNSSVRSKEAGVRVDAAMTQTIIKSYKSHRLEGKTKKAIYRDAMIRHFQAQVVTSPLGNKILLNARGEPLPTYDQYWYQVEKILGKGEVRSWRLGQNRYRHTEGQDKGKFSESVTNLMERVEADAYQVMTKPVSVTGQGHLSNLVVARIVDVASGLRLGTGFSLAGESHEAYNAAMFCMAIDKQIFGKLFGIEIDPATHWPSVGLSPHAITDRGPGVKPEPGRADDPRTGAIIREITPSGQGQSKAIVESSQRRETQLEGPKKIRQSDKSPVELAIQEIRRLMIENATADASGHMTSEMVIAGVSPTPVHVWNFMDSRARNDAQSIDFDQAVRRFLPKVEVTLDRAGIWYKQQRYVFQTLPDSFVARVGKATEKLSAYIYPMALRYIWVQIDGQLHWAEAVLNINDDPGMLYRTREELELSAAQMYQLQAQRRDQSYAEGIEQHLAYRKQTGKDMDSVASVTSRHKRTQATREEERRLKEVLGQGGGR